MSDLVPATITGRNARLIWRRVAERPEIQPGEEVVAAFTGQKYLSYALLVFGEMLYLLLSKPYYVGVTDRRVLLFTCSKLSGRIGDLVWDAPRNQVDIVEQKRGALRDVIALRRHGDERDLRLRVHRTLRDQVARAVAPALPPPSSWGS